MNEETVGREPVIYAQIDQDLCNLTYSVAPCTAALGVTGDEKCFNTRATCQDPDNYDRGSLTLTFARNQEDVSVDGLYIIPSLTGISTSPTVLNPGAGGRDSGPLGTRATATLTFQDHPHSDNLVDPYLPDRNYIATDRGTFWSKWLARNPFYNNREVRIYEGYRGQSLSEMRVRTYLIDRIDGPDSRGQVRMRAKDVLKLADNERAVAPAVSTGELIVDVDEGVTSDIRITGAVAADYPAPGTVRINDELVTFTGVTTISSTEIRLTGVTRATDGSEPDDHEAEDRVQLCLRYTDVRVDDLAFEWLTEYGDVPTAFIDQTAWGAEASIWLAQFTLSGLITEPTGVTDLLSEITEQALFYIWWDEREQLINLEAIKPFIGSPPQFTDDANIIEDSARLRTRPDERVSQVWVFWGQRDPTQRLDDEQNFRRLRVRADLAAEGVNQYNEKRIKRVFSRWLVSESQAINVSVRLLSRYRDNPRYLTIDMDAKDRATWTGDVLDVTHRGVVDFTGQPELTRWQVISADEAESGHRMRYDLQRFEFGAGQRFGTWMESDAPDYGDATFEEKQVGAWWADANGEVDGDEGYNWS